MWSRCYDAVASVPDAVWQHRYKRRHVCGKEVNTIVKHFSKDYHNFDTLPRNACNPLFIIAERSQLDYAYVIDELNAILEDGNKNKNLTEKYYVERAVKILQQRFLQRKMNEFLLLSPDKQLLEEGACIIAQWFQSEVCSLSSIAEALDDLAAKVRGQLLETNPKHPACAEANVPLIDIGESLWGPRDCRVALEAVNTVLFTQLGLLGNEDDYYDINNSFINQVLAKKKGNPITLSVVYQAVALRLGVVCHPVNFPSHFLLKFCEHPELDGYLQYTYIDAFHSGKFMDAHECRTRLGGLTVIINNASYATAPPLSVLQRMVRNLFAITQQRHGSAYGLEFLLSVLELTFILDPSNSVRMNLARIYLTLNVNVEEIDGLLAPIAESDHVDLHSMVSFLRASATEQIQDNRQSNQVTAKLSTDFPEVQYSVGQIMKHKRYHYTCVIYSWDKECRASMEWIHQMGVHTLPQGQWQPFYGVLVEDGSQRYAAQESLEMAADPKCVTHPQTGKHFEEYTGTYYVLNSETQQRFPQDMERTITEADKKYSAAS